MLALVLIAFVASAIISLYPFSGFRKMKKWKQWVLIISLTAAWTTGIWIACAEHSKSNQSEKDTAYLKQAADSTRKDLKTVLAILKKNKLHIDIIEDTVYTMDGFYKIHPDLELKGKLEALQNERTVLENEKREADRQSKLAYYSKELAAAQGMYKEASSNRSKYKEGSVDYNYFNKLMINDSTFIKQYQGLIQKYKR